MDWKQILSLVEGELDDDKKDVLYEDLIFLKEDSKIDGKSYKKLFKLSQTILKYKGDQVTSLLNELDTIATREGVLEAVGSTTNIQPLKDEIEKHKKHITKLETEKNSFKIKIKELSEEIAILQKKIQSSSHFGSEAEDSPDALSEIDRQQELMNNIAMKNKHIKRLLRDIEDFEKQNKQQSKSINELRSNLSDATLNLTSLTNEFNESQNIIKDQKEIITELNNKIVNLKDELRVQYDEKIERQKEIDYFGKQLEERVLIWKTILDEKEAELEGLKAKYDELLEKNPGYDIDMERKELSKLSKILKQRDEMIKNLENKIAKLSKEMIISTDFMTKLSKDKEMNKEKFLSLNKDEKCCEEKQLLLEKSHKRCKELQEMLVDIEDENLLKSKQALEALEALKMYQSGEDGLPNALNKIQKLNEQIHARDKQIKQLILEINAASDVAAENCILRKRLGMDDDEHISTSGFIAKGRKYEKIADRLSLKLKASEEMRLQLKLEKNDLKRQLMIVSKNMSKPKFLEKGDGDTTFIQQLEGIDIENIKICEGCLQQFNVIGRLCKTCIEETKCPFCLKCAKRKTIVPDGAVQDLKKRNESLQSEYSNVVEENENLRIGMHEILAKLRDYDATSSHITIDSSTLEKLLHALDARSISGWYHPAMRMQNELLIVKERELALKEKIKINQEVQKNLLIEAKPIETSQEKQRDTIEEVKRKDSIVLCNELTKKIQEVEDIRLELKIMVDKNNQLTIEKEELQMIQTQYDDLVSKFKESDNSKDKFLVENYDKINKIELNINSYQRKLEFMKCENDNLNNTLKSLKMDFLNIVHELKYKLVEQNRIIEDNNITKSNSVIIEKDKDDETTVENLKLDLERKKLQINNYCSLFLKHFKTNPVSLSADDVRKFEKITVINDNFTTEFITKQEFNKMKAKLNQLDEEFTFTKVENGHLRDLLNVSQEQLISQQQMITKYSDDEISLRHLVTDLQSSSNEKYIIAKTQKEVDLLREKEENYKILIDRLKKSLNELEWKIQTHEDGLLKSKDEFAQQEKDNILKIAYLKKALSNLLESYGPFTPLFAIADFVKQYTNTMELRNSLQQKEKELSNRIREDEFEKFSRKIKENLNANEIQDKINIIKYQTQSEYLTKQLILLDDRNKELQNEIDSLKLMNIMKSELWDTIKLLFIESETTEVVVEKKYVDNCVQISIDMIDKCTNTEDVPVKAQTPEKRQEIVNEKSESLVSATVPDKMDIVTQKSLESQLKQAMILASTRSSLLLEMENRLSESQGRVKVLEKNIEEKESQLKKNRELINKQADKSEDSTFSQTISSFQNLLLEKDTTLSRYQELLKNERQQSLKTYDDKMAEIKGLKKNIMSLNDAIELKEKEIENTHIKHAEEMKKINMEKSCLSPVQDEKKELEIEELKLQLLSYEKTISGYDNEMKILKTKLNHLESEEKSNKVTMVDKNDEIANLNEQLLQSNNPFILEDLNDNVASQQQEIQQLREIVDEKDRHINDLTETLSQFHDDQQNYLKDTSLQSAEQVTQLSADLTRSETTNRIFKTQIEALKRQIANILQREKQSRELIRTLKNQLMRRPVISLKPERIPNIREDQLQRKINHLENELTNTKDELRKQMNINENRRAKNAAELGLWDKQKRWQQLAEKLKMKMNEINAENEKLKAHFGTAKNTISRLEREKHILENRIKTNRICQNCHGGKYTPDSYTTENTGPSPTNDRGENDTPVSGQSDIIDALKSRIETQQRKIVSLELEGKGSHSMSIELEKLQDRLAHLESQNVRLESKNIQLELEANMGRQTNENDKLRHQIKHLEDYILVLKNELTQAITKLNMYSTSELELEKISNSSKDKQGKSKSSLNIASNNERTILSLRRIVEKLKLEVKTLREAKDGPTVARAGNNMINKQEHEKLQHNFDKLQQAYSEALGKISALQIELQCASCPHCNRVGTTPDVKDSQVSNSEGLMNEMKVVQEKLSVKTQLLEKAKILLTRAAAKERNLKEQIDFLRRKCSELQNVPVIDEASE